MLQVMSSHTIRSKELEKKIIPEEGQGHTEVQGMLSRLSRDHQAHH